MNILKKYKRWEREVYKKKAWNIGFLDYDDATPFRHFKIAWLDWCGYDKGWFADPFILSVDGNRVEVLVEEMMLDKPPATVWQVGRRREATRRWGRISKLEIERGADGVFRLQKVVPVIEDKLHYSFPAIYRDADGAIFIHPENGESGKSPLFRYDAATSRAVPAGTLCDAPLADAVLSDAFAGQWLCFATRVDEPGADCGNTLGVYRSTTGTQFGPYETTPWKTILFPDDSARGAGYFLRLADGRVLRVAQDCTHKYGAAVVFYAIKFENGEFSVEEVARHFSDIGSVWHVGLHTFNTFGNLAVVDGYGYLHPLKRALYRAKDFIKRLFCPACRGI